MFSRLGEYRTRQKEGQIIGVLGCLAQQEGEEIFERAPWVSLVCGSASYRKLPELLAQLEAGDQRVTGLDTDTDETFETEITRRDNPWRAYLTIIEGCDKSCAYCVVPYTRGPERSRASGSVLREVQQLGRSWLFRGAIARANGQFVRRPVGSGRVRFSELLLEVADVPGIRRVRFTTSHPRDFTPDIVAAIESEPRLCNHVHLPVQSGSTRVLAGDAAHLYARRVSGEDRDDSRGEDGPSASRRISSWVFRARPSRNFRRPSACWTRCVMKACFRFKYSPRPNTASLSMSDPVSDEEKGRRLAALQERQRQHSERNGTKRCLGASFELMVSQQVAARKSMERPLVVQSGSKFHFPSERASGNLRAGPRDGVGPSSLVGEYGT